MLIFLVLQLLLSEVRKAIIHRSEFRFQFLKLDEKYKLGIFEAGISLPGEMEKLQKIIDPDIGVITNIGDATVRILRITDQKQAEKLKLFKNSSLIVYCSDHELIRSTD